MTYIDTSDTGQGAKLNNQDILGCLFYALNLTHSYYYNDRSYNNNQAEKY